MRIRKIAAAIALGTAATALSACAQTITSTVSRYQAMPAPQGQTFYVVPDGGMARNGGLEFQRYAGIVAQQLEARGYRPASDAQSANMIVQFGYGVDHGQIDLHIRAAGTNQPLFDGRAQARSQTNRLDVLVPSLVEALFTGFPGRSGEVVKITVPRVPRA